MRVASLYRYPVKGLSPEPMRSVDLSPGGTMPADRRYAIENGPSGFAPETPAHLPKALFFVLMRDEALARLATRYDDASDTLEVTREGETSRFALATPEGREGLARLVAAQAGEAARGPARVLRAGDFSFSDVPDRVISLINLASVRAIEDMVGAPVDPLRFRANLYLEDLPAWAELDMVGQRLLGPSGLTLEVVARTKRCAATNVDPLTGIRDLLIPRALMQALGHADCGVYARVMTGGRLAEGMRLSTAGQDDRAPLPF
jgi:uncharacterized protein YcbX